MWRRALTLGALLTLCAAMYYATGGRALHLSLSGDVADPAQLGIREATAVPVKRPDAELQVWSVPAAPGKPTVYYLHGILGGLSDRKGRFRRLTDQGYGLLALGYRGSSGSTGDPARPALVDDAAALYAMLDPARTVIYGESLGSSVAFEMLARPGTPQPAAMILESPATSWEDVVGERVGFLSWLPAALGHGWQAMTAAPEMRAPVLILHGARDRVVPIAQADRLYEALGSEERLLYRVSDAGHMNVWRAETRQIILAFIDAYTLAAR